MIKKCDIIKICNHRYSKDNEQKETTKLNEEEGIEVWNTVLEQIVRGVKIGWIATLINLKSYTMENAIFIP